MSELQFVALGALSLAVVQAVGIIIGLLIDKDEAQEAAWYWWFTSAWLLWLPAAAVVGTYQGLRERRALRRVRKARLERVTPPGQGENYRVVLGEDRDG